MAGAGTSRFDIKTLKTLIQTYGIVLVLILMIIVISNGHLRYFGARYDLCHHLTGN